MNLTAVCEACGRELLVAQLAGPGGGRCPWCGASLAPGYTDFLAQAAARVERLGAEFSAALRRLLAIPSRLRLDVDVLVEALGEEAGLETTQRATRLPLSRRHAA
jgi:hypothetical protein